MAAASLHSSAHFQPPEGGVGYRAHPALVPAIATALHEAEEDVVGQLLGGVGIRSVVVGEEDVVGDDRAVGAKVGGVPRVLLRHGRLERGKVLGRELVVVVAEEPRAQGVACHGPLHRPQSNASSRNRNR